MQAQLAHAHPTLDLSDLSADSFDDPVSERILDEAGRTLGRMLADLCNLINPSALVIGGLLGSTGAALLHGVESSIRRHSQPATAAAIEVLPATLGTRAELVGALHLAASQVGL